MRFKVPLKWPLPMVGTTMVALSFAGILFLTPADTVRDSRARAIPIADRPAEETQDNLLKDQVIPELPIRLKIPKINVDTSIEHVGLTPQGAMDVPQGPANVAWFSLGARPGEGGSAVISGHYGWKNNIPAVFDDLHKLQKGDKVYVESEKGIVLTFVVRELRSYGENEGASAVFSSSDGKAHLNLITCEGVWNKASKSYSSRLVVFTDME